MENIENFYKRICLKATLKSFYKINNYLINICFIKSVYNMDATLNVVPNKLGTQSARNLIVVLDNDKVIYPKFEKDLLAAAADANLENLFDGTFRKATKDSFGKNKTKDQLDYLMSKERNIEQAQLTKAINLVYSRVTGQALQVTKHYLEEKNLRGALEALKSNFSVIDYATAVKSIEAINDPCPEKDAISAIYSRKEKLDELLKRFPESSQINMPNILKLALITVASLGSTVADGQLQEGLLAFLKRPNIDDKDVTVENLTVELIRLSHLNRLMSEKAPNIFQISNDVQKPKVSKASRRINNSKNCIFHPQVAEGHEHSSSQCHIVRNNPSLMEKFSDIGDKTNQIFINQAAKRPVEQVRHFPAIQENSTSSSSSFQVNESESSSSLSKPSPEYYVNANGKIQKISVYPNFF